MTKTVDAQYSELEAINGARRQADLLALLNTKEGFHATSKAPITREMHDRITFATTALKKASDALELLEPNDDKQAFAILKQLDPVDDLFRKVRIMPSLGLEIGLRAVRYTEGLAFDRKGPRDPAKLKWKSRSDAELSSLEERALLTLGDLLKSRKLGDLRRCECGEWFLAVRSDQRSHSVTCRMQRYAKSEDFNAKRRARYAAAKKLAAAKKTARKRSTPVRRSSPNA